ncbi:tyrosine-type recombinase/integrase [Streptomyces sp. NPDC021080]|uniref:tyrosine-type recombinase/integrase n=1 Tax=Streptomyces sp. NPDC021080 TaxID=3365110 RepID=UPI00379B8E58
MTTLHRAVEAFVRDYPEAATTETSYALTLRRCASTLGRDRAAADVDGEDWHDVLIELWGRSAPNTWNRTRATVQTFLRWLGDAKVATVELPALCRARKVVIDETKAVDPEELEHLWDPARVALRQRTLWRLLYESSSRAEAVLALNVEDVSLKARKARAVIKGGRTIWVYFERRGAELLREYIGDRTRGPVFLTDRRPRDWRTRAPGEFAPDGRRCRLSYDRAEHILKEYAGITLHILRHSRLSYLSGEGVDTPMLMAISGHTNPGTLHRRYARPSGKAVTRLFDRLDQLETADAP